jgi:hypothetical protein
MKKTYKHHIYACLIHLTTYFNKKPRRESCYGGNEKIDIIYKS